MLLNSDWLVYIDSPDLGVLNEKTGGGARIETEDGQTSVLNRFADLPEKIKDAYIRFVEQRTGMKYRQPIPVLTPMDALFQTKPLAISSEDEQALRGMARDNRVQEWLKYGNADQLAGQLKKAVDVFDRDLPENSLGKQWSLETTTLLQKLEKWDD